MQWEADALEALRFEGYGRWNRFLARRVALAEAREAGGTAVAWIHFARARRAIGSSDGWRDSLSLFFLGRLAARRGGA